MLTTTIKNIILGLFLTYYYHYFVTRHYDDDDDDEDDDYYYCRCCCLKMNGYKMLSNDANNILSVISFIQ